MAAPMQLRTFYRIFRQFKKKSLCRTFSASSVLSNKNSPEEKTTHFGFQTVTEEEKEKEGILPLEDIKQVLAFMKNGLLKIL